MAETFTQGSGATLQFYAGAVQWTDSNGYGPVYLLNGLTDKGNWYQVGIGYYVPDGQGGYQNGGGWIMRYDYFDTTGNPISTGFLAFSSTVQEGDRVLLTETISSGNVVLTATDCGLCYSGATQFSRSISFSANGASSFIGLTNSHVNSYGYFTGFMTEKQWVSQNTANMVREQFFNFGNGGSSSAWLEAEEKNINTNVAVYNNWTPTPLSFSSQPTTLQTFTTNGQTLQADAYLFLSDTAVGTKTETSHVCIINPNGGACVTSLTTSHLNTIIILTTVPMDTTPSTVQYFVNGGGGSVKTWSIASTGWDYFQNYGTISHTGTFTIYSVTTFSDQVQYGSNRVTLTLT